MKKHALIIFFIFFIFCNFITSHYIKKINYSSASINGYTNQSQQFPIPFKKCFKVTPQLEANQKYFNFKPSSLQLLRQTSFLLSQNHNISLLESLRSSLTYKHKAMTVLEQQSLIMLFSAPNKILIIKEQQNSFKLIDQYRIEQMKNLTAPFKLYKFSKNRSIMIVQNHRSFYLLDDKGYQQYSLPVDITFAHFENLQSQEILIAEFNKGLGHYRLNHQTKSIDLVKLYKKNQLGLTESYIVDVNTNFASMGQIYLLDAKSGLIRIKYDNKTKKLSDPEIIVHQSNCQAFDAVENDYFVLLCQIQGYSSIIQVYKKQQNNITKYERLEPEYFSTFFTDIEVSNKFYMIFSNKLINVFWNTKKNRLPQALQTQSKINIPGLQIFKLKKIKENGEMKMFLYTVQSGYLVKYLIEQSSAKLSFHEEQPMSKSIILNMYGSCEDIGQNRIQQGEAEGNKNNDILTCQIRQQFVLNFQDQLYSKPEDFSISASIIILLILIFLVIIWICLKKYKGLEKQARKVLQVYKKKKGNQQRAI